MAFAEVDGASLYYEVHGAGPWLAWVHGAGGNHLSWWQQVPVFAPSFRCLTYDQRGWGRSRCAGAPDPSRFASDLAQLLDVVGAKRAALVGQSMGGWAVLGCALARPERVTHLVLASTVAGLTDETETAMLVRGIEAAGPPVDGTMALAADFPAREPVRTFLFEEIAALNPPLTPAFLRALVEMRYAPRPGVFSMPVAVIAGSDDRLFPLELMRRVYARFPDAALTIVPSAGHSVYFERPREFNESLARILGVRLSGSSTRAGAGPG